MSNTDIPVTNPRTGEVDYHVPAFDAGAVAAAAARLRCHQPAWEALGSSGRAQALMALSDAIGRHGDAIFTALSEDTGRRLMARVETSAVRDWMNYWAQRAPRLLSEDSAGTSRMAPSVRWSHRLIPYSVVGIISPWNVPLLLGLIDAVPALAAGCGILLKPSEVTPRFAEPLSQAIAEVPELAGVVEIVTGGPETGQALIENADAVCFTGSVPTGRKVAVQAASHFVPAFLELGGKDPAIVLPSADLDQATDAILRSAVGMTGQACQSLERIYVHESVMGRFLERLVEKARAVELNWPDPERGQIGPFIFPPQGAKVQAHIDQAVEAGAQILCGGQVEEHGGSWCRPTVLTGVTHEMAIMREETFGPIMPVMPFSTTEEAIALANDSDFGLSGAVFAGSREEGEAVAEQVTGGAISVNDASLTSQVHDVAKNSFCLSGMGGSRMGDDGLMRFLRKRAILYQSGTPSSLAIMDESLSRGSGPGDDAPDH
jgi:acyl-CoA reductase-like NAD-dependent aldehyde dehydrogenase